MLQHKPMLDIESVHKLLGDLYGIRQVSGIKKLPGERDLNFLVGTKQQKYVLKVSNGLEKHETLLAQTAMMQKLRELGFCPQVTSTTGGLDIAELKIEGQTHFVRLVSFLDGKTLGSIKFRSPELLRDLGKKVALIDNTLADFDHPALHYDFDWDLAKGIAVVQEHKHLLQNAELLDCVESVLEKFNRHTAPYLDRLPCSVIHNDANDGNVIISSSADEVCGVIDLGDAIHSWTVNDLAIGIAYAVFESTQPLSDATEIIKGYHAERPLQAAELDSLFGLVCLRMCVSACMAARQIQVRPEDEYLSISQQPILKTLPKLAAVPFRLAAAVFRQTCGLPATDSHDAVVDFLESKASQFEFILQPKPDKSDLVLIDWSVESLLQENVLNLDLDAADRKIAKLLKGNKVGVGRYREPRLVYASDQFGGDAVTERRTIHLGVDLFADAGTQLVAPHDGEVVVLHEIEIELDYGTLLILRHQTEEGDDFFTLYGHLDWNSTNHLQVGQNVNKGEPIAQLGARKVNGGWTPHLHFQIMLDLLDFENDFPGVAKASELAAWVQLCPNPNLILGLPDNLTTYQATPKSDLLDRRERLLGGSLSIGYRDPVNVVRGKSQYLFDENGRRYLDAYNNVPHIGHCHPAAIEAAHKQMQLVNTNTRYLHETILQFAESLAATMPDPLNVCFILNSASEANELALRMMRCVTGSKDLIVLEGAYHGHTSGLIDISPYKHDGPGGQGKPDWVHTAPVADIFRGEFRDQQTAGKLYAEKVSEICDSIMQSGRGLNGFIAESCPSVGGQIIFPPGYLAEVYKNVRNYGGLCVADDVQTGYGRLGTAFYGFELQDVVPDIVVLGKPIGNGHPLAALVTTKEIADTFHNGMEFFSTFGGNNVSCAVGTAVLDTVQSEGLQQHALEVGKLLLAGMRELASRFEIVGDVRGSGLFLGMELVRDRQTLEPADTEASFISNRMRDRGVLLGTDGPLHNVVKIRPPMPFDKNDAQHLLEMLEICFEELSCH